MKESSTPRVDAKQLRAKLESLVNPSLSSPKILDAFISALRSNPEAMKEFEDRIREGDNKGT